MTNAQKIEIAKQEDWYITKSYNAETQILTGTEIESSGCHTVACDISDYPSGDYYYIVANDDNDDNGDETAYQLYSWDDIIAAGMVDDCLQKI